MNDTSREPTLDELAQMAEWEEDLQEMIREIWEKVEHHPDECECIDCWELYVLTYR